MAHEFDAPITVIPWRTAVVHVDVQAAFFKAQGTLRTERIAAALDKLVPSLKKAGYAQFAAYSKASSMDQANLIPAFKREEIFCFEKGHESAARQTGLIDRLRKGGRNTVLLTGFHATSCVMQTALDLQRSRFMVIIDPALIGEGQRGRGLTEKQIDQRTERALRELARQGAHIGPVANLPAPQAI